MLTTGVRETWAPMSAGRQSPTTTSDLTSSGDTILMAYDRTSDDVNVTQRYSATRTTRASSTSMILQDGADAKPVVFGDLYSAYEIHDLLGINAVRDDLSRKKEALTE